MLKHKNCVLYHIQTARLSFFFKKSNPLTWWLLHARAQMITYIVDVKWIVWLSSKQNLK